MSLFLIRHAKSSWAQVQLSDFERPLNIRGTSDLLIMKEQLLQKGWSFDKVISSSSVRTKLTCEGLGLLAQYRDDLYHASADKIKDVVDEYSDVKNLAIVGHNPGLTLFLNIYCDSKIENVPTLGICKISNNLTVEEFIFPKLFK